MSSTMSVPLIVRGKAIGAITFVTSESRKRLTEADLKMAEELANRAAIAIENAQLYQQAKHADEAIRANEERFRLLVENSADAIALVDKNGKFTYVSPPVEKVLGYTPEELIGKDTLFLFPKGHLEEIQHLFAPVLEKSGVKVSVEHKYVHKDGSIRWLESRIMNLLNKPNINALVSNFRDITESKTASEKLRESEERFRTLAEAIPQVVYVADAKGRPVFFNRRWFEYTGLTKEFKAKDWISVIHPDDLPAINKNFKKAFAKKDIFSAEYRIRDTSGNYHWFLGRSVPLLDTKKNIIRWFGTATDIMEQKRIEENLSFISKASKILSSSLDYKTTLQNVAQLAVPYIADWCSIEMMNEQSELQLVAIAHKDQKKVNWAEEFRKTNPFMDGQLGLYHIIETGKPVLYTNITDSMLKKIARNKKELDVLRNIAYTSAMIVPIFLHKKSIGLISFVTTETKRNYTEADLVMAEELASRASFAIENARLYSEAQKAITLRDEFISVASHELKTPLTSMKMYTQVIKDKLEKEGNGIAIYPLTKVDEQIRKLSNLNGDLLNVSKVQLGKLEFHQESFDINKLVKSVIETVQPTIQKHTILLKGNSKKRVFGDKDRIGQVVTNLLTNAIKYSPNAHQVIVQLVSEKDAAVVSVQDFGIGIDQEYQKRIFERFYRVNNAEERTFPGLGLDLYISHQIIQRYGGKMNVVSKKGKGSQFSFTVPYTAVIDSTKQEKEKHSAKKKSSMF